MVNDPIQKIGDASVDFNIKQNADIELETRGIIQIAKKKDPQDSKQGFSWCLTGCLIME